MKFERGVLTISFSWPTWLVPRRVLGDLRARASLTGSAGRTWRWRAFQVGIRGERVP